MSFCEGRIRIPHARAENALGCHSFMPALEAGGGVCDDYYDPVSMAKCSTYSSSPAEVCATYVTSDGDEGTHFTEMNPSWYCAIPDDLNANTMAAYDIDCHGRTMQLPTCQGLNNYEDHDHVRNETNAGAHFHAASRGICQGRPDISTQHECESGGKDWIAYDTGFVGGFDWTDADVAMWSEWQNQNYPFTTYVEESGVCRNLTMTETECVDANHDWVQKCVDTSKNTQAACTGNGFTWRESCRGDDTKLTQTACVDSGRRWIKECIDTNRGSCAFDHQTLTEECRDNTKRYPEACTGNGFTWAADRLDPDTRQSELETLCEKSFTTGISNERNHQVHFGETPWEFCEWDRLTSQCSSGGSENGRTSCERTGNTQFLTCNPDPCQNGGLCKPISGGMIKSDDHFSCDCANGYTGRLCEIAPACLTNADCESGACRDGVCNCWAGWTGVNCETPEPQPCASGPDGNLCQRGGTPQGTQDGDDTSGCSCECPTRDEDGQPLYIGNVCQFNNRISCLGGRYGRECQNGGRPSGFQLGNDKSNCTCECEAGWEGNNCENRRIPPGDVNYENPLSPPGKEHCNVYNYMFAFAQNCPGFFDGSGGDGGNFVYDYEIGSRNHDHVNSLCGTCSSLESCNSQEGQNYYCGRNGNPATNGKVYHDYITWMNECTHTDARNDGSDATNDHGLDHTKEECEHRPDLVRDGKCTLRGIYEEATLTTQWPNGVDPYRDIRDIATITSWCRGRQGDV